MCLNLGFLWTAPLWLPFQSDHTLLCQSEGVEWRFLQHKWHLVDPCWTKITLNVSFLKWDCTKTPTWDMDAHFNKCLSTELWAVSLPLYMFLEAHSMMALFMRYWTVSIRTTESPYIWISRSMRLRDKPFDAALQQSTHKINHLNRCTKIITQCFKKLFLIK